jgi:UDP-glucose 4-epimerase
MFKNVVTGGAGFIGSHLVEHLLEQGERVLVWDDLSTGTLDNLAPCRGHPRLDLRIGDIAADPRFPATLAGVDCVYHLAARTGVRRFLEDPIGALVNNRRATEAAVAAATREGARFLFASSSEVYGRGGDQPLREDDDIVCGPTARRRWGFGAGKAADEHLVLAHCERQGLKGVVVRLFNTSGPRQSAAGGMVIPTFVAQARAGGPLLVHGDGRQRRCFAHVRDVVPALRRLMNCPAAEGDVVNLGTDVEATVVDVARRVAGLLAPGGAIRLVRYDEAMPAGFDDVARRVPDLSKVRALTGYAPLYGLDDIIEHIVSHDAPRASFPPAS